MKHPWQLTPSFVSIWDERSLRRIFSVLEATEEKEGVNFSPTEYAPLLSSKLRSQVKLDGGGGERGGRIQEGRETPGEAWFVIFTFRNSSNNTPFGNSMNFLFHFLLLSCLVPFLLIDESLD